MRNKKVTYMLQAAMIAAIYVVLVIIFDYWSFGVIQFRVAEALTILPVFSPAAIPGLFIGCILANFMGGCILADVVFGSVATLLGAIGTYLIGRIKFKNAKYFAPIPPIIANTIIVPFILKYGYGTDEAIPYMMATVGAGEIIVCAVLGLIVMMMLEKYKNIIFAQSASQS